MAAQFSNCFEIANSPVSMKQMDQSVVIEELLLAPFAAIPKLEFDDVSVGSSASLFLNLRNPSDLAIKVVLVIPKDFLEEGLNVNSREFFIQPRDKAILEVTFQPKKVLQTRYTIYAKDLVRNYKGQFQLIARSVAKKKMVKRRTWNINQKPISVPAAGDVIESFPRIDSALNRPILRELSIAASVNSPADATFSLGTPPDSSTSCGAGNATFVCEEKSLEVVFEDSLEVDENDDVFRRGGGLKGIIPEREQSKEEVLVMTYESGNLTQESDKENCPSSKKGPPPLSFPHRPSLELINAMNFDNLTPDQGGASPLRRSEHLWGSAKHNTSTPYCGSSKTKKTLRHERVEVSESLYEKISKEFRGSPQPSPATPRVALPENEVREGEYRRVTTYEYSVMKETYEILTPVQHAQPASSDGTRGDRHVDQAETNNPNQENPYQAPTPVTCDQDTPANQNEITITENTVPTVVVEPAATFDISPPKKMARKALFKIPSSTPYKAQMEGSFNDTNISTVSVISKDSTKKHKPVKAFVPKPSKSSALSPRSLVSFKKTKLRPHLPPLASRPSSAKSTSSTESEEETKFYSLAGSSEYYTVRGSGGFSTTKYESAFQEPLCSSVAYSSTTLTDPFARSAIHPLEYQDKQATELIKWVNSILTIPEEYSAYESGNVDVAQLWKKSVASDSSVLPASRETVCSEYHKNETHLFNLRKKASLIFKSAEMTDTLYKVHAKISVGFISVKDDIDLHCDQGARCLLVQFLMYYNPLWLRIGLEAIYGQIIPLQQKNVVVGLMIFIKNNFLSDQYIIKKNTYQNSHHRMPKFKKEMNDYIVFKFLSLLLFLDVAKKNTIVPYDPCLFKKNAPIKESEVLMTEFIKEFIKCVGQMKKTLKSIGYVLTHKQLPIDEYDFAVKTHLDLRDGVSLTRLMELILRKRHLIQKLRVPSISRLQKVHNVKVAFAALEGEGMTVVDVVANDVVDGHREKIMSLLWQVLHTFLKPRLESAARTIQTWWRNNCWKIRLNKRILEKKEQKRSSAATKIQSLWRGYLCRKCFQETREILITEREKRLAMKKEMMERRRLTSKAAITIQSRFRAMVLMKKQRATYLAQIAAAIKIQQRYRATVLMKEQKATYQRQRTSTIKIQQWYRATVAGRKQRAEYLFMLDAIRKEKEAKEAQTTAAIKIQQRYRAIVLMKEQKATYQRQRIATIKIQQWYRATVAGRKQRAEYLFMLDAIRKEKETKEAQTTAAFKIGQWYRATVLMKEQKVTYQCQKRAAIKIQVWYRATVAGKKQRNEYLSKLTSVKIIQTRYRATVLMKQQQAAYQRQRTAVIKIQQWYKATVAGRKQRAEYLSKLSAVKIIQMRYRATVLMKQQQAAYQCQQRAAIKIQQWRRATVAGRKQRAEYLSKLASVKIIQTRYRATVLMKTQKATYQRQRTAVIKIQQWYRATVAGQKQRAEFLSKLIAVKIIQMHYRATLLMKQQQAAYQYQRTAAIKIQQWYRATVAGRKQRTDYLSKLSAVKIIQTGFRATVLMKTQKEMYQRQRTAAFKIQQWYRATVAGRKQHTEYLSKLNAVKIIQTRFRATMLMKEQRATYKRLWTAAIKIQQWYRATIAGRKQRAEYLFMLDAVKKEKKTKEAQTTAAVKILQWYRATVAGRKQRAEYLSKLIAVKIIQMRYRATVLMKQQQAAYQCQRRAAIKIQQWYKAMVAGQNQRAEYLSKLIAVKIIQAHYRATVLMKQQQAAYQGQQRAAVKIQQWYRATVAGRKERGEYLTKLTSVKIIQTHYRARVLMKEQRASYQRQRIAATKIQQWYRATVAGRKQRTEYLSKLSAVTIIQTSYRASLLMKEQKATNQRLQPAAIRIQRWYRTTVAGRKQRGEYLSKLSAMKIIEARYRATLLMKEQKATYQRLRTAAIKIQQWYRATVAGRKQRAEYLFMLDAIKKEMKTQEAQTTAAIKILQWYRATVASRKERAEYLSKLSAAVTIQRAFRAHRARVTAGNVPSPAQAEPKLKDIFEDTTSSLIQTQRRSMHLSYVSYKNLDFILSYSPILCERLAEPAFSCVYQDMFRQLDVQCRSDAYQSIFKLIMNILLKLSRFEPTYDTLWQNALRYEGFDILSHILFKFYLSNKDLFCGAATVLWLLSRKPEEVETIRNQSKIVDMLKYLKTKISMPELRNGRPLHIVLPRLAPDWGYVRDRQHQFLSTQDALSVLSKRFL